MKPHVLASVSAFLLASAFALPSYAADCIFYQDNDRGGSSWAAHAYEAASLGGIWWNDRISSVWVRPGYRAKIFRDSHFSGSTTTYYGTGGGIPAPDGGRYFNLGSAWGDATSAFVCESVNVAQTPACTVYQNSDGSGASWAVSEGIYVANLGAWNDNISDVYIADNHELIVYEHINYTGQSTTFDGCTTYSDVRLCPWFDVHGDGWGDRISSFICVSSE